ncbi:MAG: tRNA (guanine-N(1)-)-methyltransferase [Firmicutes bacterium ADurb.Bin506]|nr:MAG: tRNA (guanine-N(1)-)-methyltransferase [Firmicutes bacterium ADurb.Bin506]
MHVDILTIFPGMFYGAISESILGRAQEQGLLEISIHDIRNFSQDKHNSVDDYPFGGGPGMVMQAEPIWAAVQSVTSAPYGSRPPRVILTTPAGKQFTQEMAKEFASEEHLVIVCGHYEGIDERVSDVFTDEVSIGDFVLTGGELASMVIVDATARLIPGVLGDSESAKGDSFYDGILDYPHYTRPRQWRGMDVPEVLVSGDHEKIRVWRRTEALKRTLMRRPDLLETAALTDEDRQILRSLLNQ